jgi:hypothetical protein
MNVLDTIDLPMLIKQREALVYAIEIALVKDKELLQGLLTLVDLIIDEID